MRVVCVDDNNQNELPNCPFVKKGKVYTVLEVYHCPIRDKDYYVFFETGSDNGYLTTMFIQIEEDQQDETELLKERESNLINI